MIVIIKTKGSNMSTNKKTTKSAKKTNSAPAKEKDTEKIALDSQQKKISKKRSYC